MIHNIDLWSFVYYLYKGFYRESYMYMVIKYNAKNIIGSIYMIVLLTIIIIPLTPNIYE